MEEFKTTNGKTVRLASRSSHVVTVGPDWTPVPEPLVPKALAARCVSKEVYDSVEKEVAEGACQDAPQEPGPLILKALEQINEESEAGKTETDSGNKLLTSKGKPAMDALSEYAGFAVTRAQLEEVLT